MHQHMPWSSNENKDLVRYSKILGGKKLRNLVLKVMPFLSSMHSCQPQQAIEPSKTADWNHRVYRWISSRWFHWWYQHKKASVRVLSLQFMKPLRTKYPIFEDLISEIHETMNDFRDSLKNNPTKELIQLLREDSERPAKNHQIFLQLMQYYLLLKI